MQVSIDKANPEHWPFVLHVNHVMTVTGMGKNKVLELLQDGELPGKRVRGRWLINKDAFVAWLKSA